MATAPDGRTAYIIRNTGSLLCLTPAFLGSNSLTEDTCPLLGSSFAQVWLIRNPDAVAPAQFELQVGALNNGTVTVIGGGACLEAANASDVNGTKLDPGGDCTANDPKELLTLG